jgi:hypothetical protein
VKPGVLRTRNIRLRCPSCPTIVAVYSYVYGVEVESAIPGKVYAKKGALGLQNTTDASSLSEGYKERVRFICPSKHCGREIVLLEDDVEEAVKAAGRAGLKDVDLAALA